MSEQKPLIVRDVAHVEPFRQFVDGASRLVEAASVDILDGNQSVLEKGNCEQTNWYYGRRLIHKDGKFGLYLLFPSVELLAAVYLTKPSSDSAQEKRLFEEAERAGWKSLDKKEFPGFSGLAYQWTLYPADPQQKLPSNFNDQVASIKKWALARITAVLEANQKPMS